MLCVGDDVPCPITNDEALRLVNDLLELLPPTELAALLSRAATPAKEPEHHESRSPDGDGQRTANALDDGRAVGPNPSEGRTEHEEPQGRSLGVVTALQDDGRLHGHAAKEPAARSEPADSHSISLPVSSEGLREVWAELTTSERNGEAQRNIDSSGIIVSWRAFRIVMNALRATGAAASPVQGSSEGLREATSQLTPTTMCPDGALHILRCIRCEMPAVEAALARAEHDAQALHMLNARLAPAGAAPSPEPYHTGDDERIDTLGNIIGSLEQMRDDPTETDDMLDSVIAECEALQEKLVATIAATGAAPSPAPERIPPERWKLLSEAAQYELYVMALAATGAAAETPDLSWEDLIRGQQTLKRALEAAESEIAEAREACPSIRMQDHCDKPLLALVNLEVSRGFNRDALVYKLHAELAALKAESAAPSPTTEATK